MTITQRHGTITNVDYDRLCRVLNSAQHRASFGATLKALSEHLAHQQIRPSENAPRTLVTMRSRIEVYDLDRGEREVFTLVYPEEADINQGKISVIAPLGRELLGRRSGEIITVGTPVGPKRFKIIKVLYQPEASGHYDL